MAGRPLSGRPLLTPSQVKGRSSLPSDEDAACRRAMVAFFTCLDHSNGSKGCIDRAVASCVWRELTRDLDSTQVRSLEQQLQSRADPILCEEWLSLMGKLCSIGGKRLFMSGVLRAWVLVEEGRLKVDTPKRERRRARSLALLEIKPKKLEPLLSKGDRVVTKQEDVNSMSSTVSDEALVVDTDQASCGVEGDVSPVFRNCACPSKRKNLKGGLKKEVLLENPCMVKSASCSMLEGPLVADGHNVPTRAALTCFSFVPTTTHQSGLDTCAVPKRASKLHSSLDKGKTSLSCNLLADVTSSKANASSQMDACLITSAAEAHARPGKAQSQVALVGEQLSGNVANAAIWKDVSLAEKNTWDVDLATSSCQAPSGSAMKRDVADIEKRPHDGVERDSQCRDEAPLTDPSLDCKLGRVSATVDLAERDHESSGATRDEISTALDLVEQKHTSINEKQHLSNYVHPLKSGDCELPALQKAYAPEACENVACDSSTKLQNCEDSSNYWPSSGCSLVAIPRDASLIDDMHSFGGDVQMTKEEGLGNTDQATMEQQQQDYYISTEVSASRDNRESSPHRNERARNCCSPIHKQKHNARPETSEAKSYATHARKILSPSHTRQIGSQPLIPAAFRRQPLPPLPKVPIAVPWAVRMAKSVAEWKANHFNYFRVGNVIKSTKDFSIGGNEIHNGHIGRITCISPEVSMSVLLDECNNAIIVPKKDWSNFDLQVVTHEVDLIDNLGNVTGKCLPCIALKQHHGGFFDILCQDGREACFVHNTFLKELSFGMFTDVGFSSARTSPSSAPLDREVHLVARSSDDTKHLPNNCESMCFELPPAGFQGSTALASSPLLPVRMKDCAAKRREEPRREVSSHIPTRGVGDACEVGGQICPFMEIGDEGLRAITSLMNFSVEDVVVDIGCGHGKILNMILQRFPCQGIGVEINSSIARVAEHQLQRYAGRANVVVDDIRNVDLHRATATVSFMLTHSFEVQGMSLREHMSKSLQPGCIVINYCYPVPGWHGSYQNGVWKYIIGEHLCAK